MGDAPPDEPDEQYLLNELARQRERADIAVKYVELEREKHAKEVARLQHRIAALERENALRQRTIEKLLWGEDLGADSQHGGEEEESHEEEAEDADNEDQWENDWGDEEDTADTVAAAGEPTQRSNIKSEAKAVERTAVEASGAPAGAAEGSMDGSVAIDDAGGGEGGEAGPKRVGFAEDVDVEGGGTAKLAAAGKSQEDMMREAVAAAERQAEADERHAALMAEADLVIAELDAVDAEIDRSEEMSRMMNSIDTAEAPPPLGLPFVRVRVGDPTARPRPVQPPSAPAAAPTPAGSDDKPTHDPAADVVIALDSDDSDDAGDWSGTPVPVAAGAASSSTKAGPGAAEATGGDAASAPAGAASAIAETPVRFFGTAGADNPYSVAALRAQQAAKAAGKATSSAKTPVSLLAMKKGGGGKAARAAAASAPAGAGPAAPAKAGGVKATKGLSGKRVAAGRPAAAAEAADVPPASPGEEDPGPTPAAAPPQGGKSPTDGIVVVGDFPPSPSLVPNELQTCAGGENGAADAQPQQQRPSAASTPASQPRRPAPRAPLVHDSTSPNTVPCPMCGTRLLPWVERCTSCCVLVTRPPPPPAAAPPPAAHSAAANGCSTTAPKPSKKKEKKEKEEKGRS